jgi:hypothetical protein
MDYSQYHPDWKDIIRPSILKRDQYKCKVCSVKHKSRVYRSTNGGYIECDEFMESWAVQNERKVITLYLQIAHLDHNKSNNDPANLQALCPIHHAKHDKEHKKFKRLLFCSEIKQQLGSTKRQLPQARRSHIEKVRAMVYALTKSKIDLDSAEQIFNECLKYVDNIK